MNLARKTLGLLLACVFVFTSTAAQTTPSVVTMQNAATATGNGTAIIIGVSAAAPGANLGAVGIQITGTFSATITFEATTDGTNWSSVMATELADDSRATTATAAGHYTILYGSAVYVRARISSYSSGTITVKGRLIPGLTARLTSGGGGGGSGSWGSITGTLSDQTDLQAALDAKQNTLTNSAGLASALSDETGSGGGGLSVFNQSPTIVTPTIASFTNATHNHSNAAGGGQIAIGSGISGLGTGIATALGVNVGSAGAPVLFNGAGGTPSSITLTNGTGLPLSTGVTGDLPFANFVQAGSAGFVGATGAGDYSHRTPTQVTAALDAFVGDSGSGGTKGLVPAPTTGDATKYLKGDGTWASVSAGIAVGGSITSGTANRVLYENASNQLGEAAGFTFDGTSVLTLGVAGTSVGGVAFKNATSGTITVQPVTGALGTVTLSLPATTGTLACLACVQTFSAAQSFSSTITQTSNSATAFESGPNGGTNPVFRLVNSTASQADGLTVTGLAAGNGVTLSAISSGSNSPITLTPKGTGGVIFPLGATATPSITFATDTNTGFYGFGNDQFSWTLAGTTYGIFSTGTGGIAEVRLGQGTQFAWSSSSNVLSSFAAAGLTSGASAAVRVTNGGTGAGSLIIGTSTVGSVGTSGVGVLVVANGTVPTSSPADEFQLYSADSAAGDANAFARNEAGEINRLTGLSARNSSSFAKTSDTTLANITGLTRNVEAGRAYAFEAELSTTSANTGGVKLAISGTATATSIDYEGILFEGTAISAKTRATALDTAVCAVTAVTAATCKIRGVIVVNAGGTLTVQFAQNASDGGASTVLANQALRLQPIS